MFSMRDLQRCFVAMAIIAVISTLGGMAVYKTCCATVTTVGVNITTIKYVTATYTTTPAAMVPQYDLPSVAALALTSLTLMLLAVWLLKRHRS